MCRLYTLAVNKLCPVWPYSLKFFTLFAKFKTSKLKPESSSTRCVYFVIRISLASAMYDASFTSTGSTNQKYLFEIQIQLIWIEENNMYNIQRD